MTRGKQAGPVRQGVHRRVVLVELPDFHPSQHLDPTVPTSGQEFSCLTEVGPDIPQRRVTIALHSPLSLARTLAASTLTPLALNALLTPSIQPILRLPLCALPASITLFVKQPPSILSMHMLKPPQDFPINTACQIHCNICFMLYLLISYSIHLSHT